MSTRKLGWSSIIGLVGAIGMSVGAQAHVVAFKSPGSGMHFTAGQRIVVYADLLDSNNQLGIIVCPAGQTMVNQPGTAGPAICSGGGTAVGWPQFQVLLDGNPVVDAYTGQVTVKGATDVNEQLNPDPINFNRFGIDGVSAGEHQLVVRGLFAPPPASNGATVDSAAITIVVDPLPPGRKTLTLTQDISGPVEWRNLIIVGNGRKVAATGSLVIENTLVTGLGTDQTSGLTANAAVIDIRNSVFEATAAVDITATGSASIVNNEFRSNNLIRYVAWNPEASPVLTLRGGNAMLKRFQGNRLGGGRFVLSGARNWLIGGDTDAEGNIMIGPRSTLYLVDSSSGITVRGNYNHHNYRGGWSQGFNISYCCNPPNGQNLVVEHNLFRGGSWPVQDVAGEFRYNLVFGYGHNWVRSGASGARMHHNVFAPEPGGGDLNQGVWFYGGERNIQIYNNTFDGGGTVSGLFAGPHVEVSGAAGIGSLRNNLFTFSRNQDNGNPGSPRIVGSSTGYGVVDYNAFYSPNNTNRNNYAIQGMQEGTTPGFAVHDVSGAGALGVTDAQLASTPYLLPRVNPYESLVDEARVWNRTQGIASILGEFRRRYGLFAAGPLVDRGDPADNDAAGRRADIGAIDANGHDTDRFGLFGDAIFANGFN